MSCPWPKSASGIGFGWHRAARLLHVPVDLENETTLDEELKSWLAFARQKCKEVAIIGKALSGGSSAQSPEVVQYIEQAEEANNKRQQSERVHNAQVASRMAAMREDHTIDQRQSPYAERAKLQHEKLQLPQFPTTTIGSFPQTREIRQKTLAISQRRVG